MLHDSSLARIMLRLRWMWERLPRAPRRKGILVAIYLFWRERFTPAGKTMGALWLLALFLEALPGLSGIWPILAVLSGAFVSAFVLSWRSPAGCVILGLPPRVRCGDSAIALVTLEDSDPSCHAGIFLLHDAIHALESSPSTPLRIPLRTRSPGRFPIDTATLLRCEPLGLMRARKHCPQTGIELIAHPRPAHIASLEFISYGRSGAEFSQMLRREAGRGGDFIGVRPWRTGDSLRDLHQQAFARFGKPVSREYATDASGGVVLALELSPATRWESMFQPYSIRLCAGLAVWLSQQGLLTGLALDGVFHSLPRDQALARAMDLLSTPPRGTPIAPRLPDIREPLLVVGYSSQHFAETLDRPAARTIKRIGIGDPRSDNAPLPDSHLWLDWFMLHRVLRDGKGLPL